MKTPNLIKRVFIFIKKFLNNFKITVGFKENVKLSIEGLEYNFIATMDTGNNGIVPTLGVEELIDNSEYIIFLINGNKHKLRKCGVSNPHVGNIVHKRPIIQIDYIEMCNRRINNCYIAITDKRNKSTKLLLNREIMSRLKLIIDPSIELTKNIK